MKIPFLQLTAATLALALTSSLEAAYVYEADGWIEGREVSARAEFEITDGNVVITLTNTGERSDYSPAHILTDVSFSFDGLPEDFGFAVDPAEDSGSRVDVAPGSSLWYGGSSVSQPTNISKEWGLATGVTLPIDGSSDTLGPYDYSVTATVPPDGSNPASFDILAEGELFGSTAGLNGTDFGLINQSSAENSVPIKNRYTVADTVIITLNPDEGYDLTELPTISEVAFSYGSTHYGIDAEDGGDGGRVPEPASLLIWLALGLSWIGWRRWRSRR